MADCALGPVSVAVFGQVQDLAIAGGIHEDVPQRPTFPLVWLELLDERDRRGFGTGGLPELQLRAHTYSLAANKSEAQGVNALVVGRLKDATLTIAGYRPCGQVFYDDSLQLANEELNGVKVHEIVASFRIFVEEA